MYVYITHDIQLRGNLSSLNVLANDTNINRSIEEAKKKSESSW